MVIGKRFQLFGFGRKGAFGVDCLQNAVAPPNRSDEPSGSKSFHTEHGALRRTVTECPFAGRGVHIDRELQTCPMGFQEHIFQASLNALDGVCDVNGL